MRGARTQRGRTVRTRWQGLLTLLLFAMVSSLAAAAIGAVLVYRSYASGLKPPEQAISETAIGTSIAYDRNGEFLYEFVDPLGGLRDPVPLSEMSPYLIAATVATEDASFYDNPPVNLNRLATAF